MNAKQSGYCNPGGQTGSYQMNQAGKELDYICSIHPDDQISIYIKEDKKLICSECIFDQDLNVNKNNSIKVRQKDIQENLTYHITTMESFVAKALDNLDNLKSMQSKQAQVDSNSIQYQITESCKILTHSHITDQEQITQLTKFANNITTPQFQAQEREINRSGSKQIPKKTGPNIFNSHQQDVKISKHKVEVSFNDPEESPNIECKISLLGQNNSEVVQDGERFKNSHRLDFVTKQDIFGSYFEVNVSMQPNQKAKYEQVIQFLQEIADKELAKDANADNLIKFKATDKMISAQILISNKDRQIPNDIQEKFDKFRAKDFDQHVLLKLGLGNFFQEVPKSHEKPFLEHLINSGFCLSLEVQFLQEIKEAIIEMAGKISGKPQMIELFSPAFSLSTDTNIKLEYSDFDAIRDHPQLSFLLMALEDLTQKQMDCSFTEIKKFEESYGEGFDHRKFEEFLKTEQGADSKSKMESVEKFKNALKILENLSDPCDIKVKGHIEGEVSVDLSINGLGLSGFFVYLWYILCSKETQEETTKAVDAFKANFNQFQNQNRSYTREYGNQYYRR